MSYEDIRNTREGFVDMGAGDLLVKIESKIVGVVAFIGLLCMQKGFFASLILGIIIGGAFPWLVGLVPGFAWIAITVFSLIWSVIGYFVGGAILGNSAIAGALVAIIIFVISFFLHKIFAGLGFSSVERIKLDAIKNIEKNTETLNTVNYNNVTYSQTTSDESVSQDVQQVAYCYKCGARLRNGMRFCTKCGSQVREN